MGAEQRYLDLVMAAVTGRLDTGFPTDFVADRKYTLGGDPVVMSPGLRTMVGHRRLASLEQLIRSIVAGQVPGDLVEVGCWNGGVLLFMAACLEVLEPGSKRRVVGFDSFAARRLRLPALAALKSAFAAVSLLPRRLQARFVNAALSSQGFATTAVDDEFVDDFARMVSAMSWRRTRRLEGGSLPDVEEAFRRYGLLGDHVVLVRGLLADTLPEQQMRPIAVLRLDVDLYDATRDALAHLYPKLEPGGFCVVDDYGAISICRKAVDEFRWDQRIGDEVSWIDDECIYWQKS